MLPAHAPSVCTLFQLPYVTRQPRPLNPVVGLLGFFNGRSCVPAAPAAWSCGLAAAAACTAAAAGAGRGVSCCCCCSCGSSLGCCSCNRCSLHRRVGATRQVSTRCLHTHARTRVARASPQPSPARPGPPVRTHCLVRGSGSGCRVWRSPVTGLSARGGPTVDLLICFRVPCDQSNTKSQLQPGRVQGGTQHNESTPACPGTTALCCGLPAPPSHMAVRPTWPTRQRPRCTMRQRPQRCTTHPPWQTAP